MLQTQRGEVENDLLELQTRSPSFLHKLSMARYGPFCPAPSSSTPSWQVASLQIPRYGPMEASPSHLDLGYWIIRLHVVSILYWRKKLFSHKNVSIRGFCTVMFKYLSILPTISVSYVSHRKTHFKQGNPRKNQRNTLFCVVWGCQMPND